MPIELSAQENSFEENLREADPMAGLHGTEARCGKYCEDYSDEAQVEE
jgi:hypothetical protein